MTPRTLRLVASQMTTETTEAEFAGAPDSLALGRIAHGDIGALGELYDRHAVAILRFAVRLVGDSDAEDLVQATFVKASQVASTYDYRANDARRWLIGIMARLRQERRRSLARFARALVRSAFGAEREAVDPRDQRSDLERGLAKLPEAKRMVLLMAEVEGYTCPEIAEALGVPLGTVWTRLHHARRELRAHYEEAVS